MSRPDGEGPGPRFVDPLLMAFGTLTALRVPAPRSLAAPVPGWAMLLAPLAGLVPGGLAALTAWGAWKAGWDPLVAAALAVAVLQLATRGLHLDGLADFADGSAASYDRDKALAVMRRGDTGPAGLAATVVVLLLQVAALAQLLTPAEETLGWLTADGPGPSTFAYGELQVVQTQSPAPPSDTVATAADYLPHLPTPSIPVGVTALLVLVVAARLAVPLACLRGVPSARPEGLGATVAGSVGRIAFGALLVVVTALLTLLAWWLDASPWQGSAAVGATVVVAALVVRRAVRRFGGITGDVIGAAVELSTAAALLALALF